MKKCIVSLILFLFPPLVLASISPGERLSSLLQSYSTYQANFKQQTLGDGNKLVQGTMGKVLLQRPKKFRWETTSPTQQVIVANGNQLWIYDKDLKQITKRTLQSHQGLDPAALLTGDVKSLLSEFDVSYSTINDLSTFVLLPRVSDSPFTNVEMSFRNHQLVSMTVKNSLGQTSRFQFSKIQLNSKLDPALFNFTVPAGVDVLTQ